MPIQHSLWRVGAKPEVLPEATLPSEQLLEDMIVAAPEILSREWMLIGRQEETGLGGRIDLLALAPDGTAILIELKRSKTPREVVAQALDYASWVEKLEPQDFVRIYARFSKGGNLDEAFRLRFGRPLDPDSLNASHQIVIVAATLDPASERIVAYLNERDIPINVLCFQVFETGAGQLLSRAWLIDPAETQVAAATTASTKSADKEPWNGEYYASFGHGPDRDWEEARHFGFLCAGGGTWYSNTLRLLKAGDLVWAKAPGFGFVGVGRVKAAAVPANEFTWIDAAGNERPLINELSNATYHRQDVDNLDLCEYFVSVDWTDTRSLTQAINETGMFGNQNTVCAPKTGKWRQTVERLKQLFPHWNS